MPIYHIGNGLYWFILFQRDTFFLTEPSVSYVKIAGKDKE